MIQNLFQTPIGRLRIIAFLEGISFLVLLFIAMPMKYYAGFPLAVKITGMIHGVLFILFLCSLVEVKISLRWQFSQTIIAFIASFLPFGTFVLDARMLKPAMNNN